jgi:FlaA1/EpsC-like NDP-sugar epimerase
MTSSGKSQMAHSLLRAFYQGKRIAVTGGAGTVGSALVRHLLEFDVKEVRVLDNNESELFSFGEAQRENPRFHAFLCDITDTNQVRNLLEGMDLVFHSAALKHVTLCERAPGSAVRCNIDGLQNVIDACKANGVKRMLFTSSDKAVNPTNVMGTSKLMGERLVTAANATSKSDGTVFFSTRFGNVAGSRGSVIPLFCGQIAEKRDLTLTHPEMTRFVMSLAEAVQLLIETMTIAEGGEVFVTKMPVVRISDLARVMVEVLAPLFDHRPEDVPIVQCGPRPGEKMFEELTTEEEIRRTFDIGEFFVILPAFRHIYERIEYKYPGLTRRPVERLYVSSQESCMDDHDILQLLAKPDVLPGNLQKRFLSSLKEL